MIQWRMRDQYLCLPLTILLTPALALAQRVVDRLSAHSFESAEHDDLRYRLFTPTQLEQTDADFPLVVFLHGAGERGDDNRRQLRHGVADFIDAKNQQQRPCYVLAPQCPRRVYWDTDQLLALIESIRDRHRVDTDRIYVTGLSMGGFATWHMLATRPELFAAAVPICGGGQPQDAAKFAHVPLWAFHGDADRTVPVDQSRQMILAVEEAGGRPKYSEYPGGNHNAWTRTYADAKMHAWMFAQRRYLGAIEPIEDGERIAFFGDSITEEAVEENGYVRVIEAALQARRPNLKINLIGAGISGHRVPDLQARLKRDLLSENPTVVLIYIGINDVWHSKRDKGTSKVDYEAGLRDLIAKINDHGARVILCTPSVIGEKVEGSNPFDEMLAEYSAISRRVAADTHTQLLDLRMLFSNHLAEHNPSDLEKGVLTRDGVHLNDAGNRFVAERMLEALGVGSDR